MGGEFPGGPVKGFLLDITGVLYNSNSSNAGSGPGQVIPGSVEAVKRLYAESKVRFVSNESTSTPAKLREKLQRLGFDIQLEHLFCPAPVAAAYVNKHKLRPHLLVHKGIKDDFASCDTSDPNCVVVGDAENEFSYANMNAAFRVLLHSKEPLLISLGCGRFYQRVDGPVLDLGGFAKALVFASGAKHVIIGKPEESYFQHAIDDLGLQRSEVVMIGDDIVSDVGGAMQHGIRGIQVRTGKWREDHYVKPDLIADDLLAAVNTILDGQRRQNGTN
ncbi:HAD-superfamily subfamily IIA hydrolase [Aphelenchoides fujianensis]|nr:HAD-superfamily subfamily IIA hydrolase [Aphelenchoides fujianensis]